MMRTYILHSMGEEFGPFSFEHVRGKIAAREFGPSQGVSVLEDGEVVIRTSTVGRLGEFRDAVEQAETRAGRTEP